MLGSNSSSSHASPRKRRRLPHLKLIYLYLSHSPSLSLFVSHCVLFAGSSQSAWHSAGHAGRTVQQAVEQIASTAGRRSRGQRFPSLEEEPQFSSRRQQWRRQHSRWWRRRRWQRSQWQRQQQRWTAFALRHLGGQLLQLDRQRQRWRWRRRWTRIPQSLVQRKQQQHHGEHHS